MSTHCWRDIFGHEEPYPEQADGIDAAIEGAEQGGYTLIEGACGTGKTMLALTAGIDRVRDPASQFERVFVLTSVKQQLTQFEADLRAINSNLPDDSRPVSGLTLVGKADVCPYSMTETGGIDDSSVYDRCEGLRERTRDLSGEGGETTAAALASEARSQQVGLADSGEDSGRASFLSVAGEAAPYRPDTEMYGDTEYCPFYAGYLENLPDDGDTIEAVPFDIEGRGHLGTDELVRLAAGQGVCPHSTMGALVPEVEVVIGNYYHAFDPVTTTTFTGALLDESTFVVCDEAHMLEPRVRDLVSDRVADTSLRDAVSELTRLVQPLQFDGDDGPDGGSSSAGLGSGGGGGDATTAPDSVAGDAATDAASLIRAELVDSDIDRADLERLREFLSALRGELDHTVRTELDRTHPGWADKMQTLDDTEIPLRDPETPREDDLTVWADEAGYDDAVWRQADVVARFASMMLDTLEDTDQTRAIEGVGRTLSAWHRVGHETYFRELELERTWDDTEPADSWRRGFNARLVLYNCVPGEAIGDRLADFGGGILMSATLEPLDTFRSVTGLDRLEERGRPVNERTYALSFPAANRDSYAVDVPKFTHDNRGPVGQESQTRQAHAAAAAAVASRPGNVLVGMPNYAEAEWMAGELRDRVEKPVLLDESSGADETAELKSAFFSGQQKVLVTSLRGTLTEGVDYRGDRLAAAVVCGVPIINTAAPRTKAVVAAYDREFGDGFETALTVPAVRKARQAVGRVIRGPNEAGVRAFVDARYARESWNAVRSHLPDHEREEYSPVSPDMLDFALDQFWS